MKIPFHKPDIGLNEFEAVKRVMLSGWLTTGPIAAAFEERFAAAVQAKYALATTSGTLASLLLLQAMGVGPGDQVVVPAWTFSGPAMMARALGADVVVCDIDKATMNMTAETLGDVMTPRTKVVMPTHFAGQAADIVKIRALADLVGAYVIGDAAHAFPASHQDARPVGGHPAAHATFFSFYATKTITCGEGGMITTEDLDLAAKVRVLRSHGMNREGFDRYTAEDRPKWFYNVIEQGWGAAMSDLHAAVGLEQLTRAWELQNRRSYIAVRYTQAFLGSLMIEPMLFNWRSAHHLFPIRLRHRKLMVASDAIYTPHARFIELMHDRGVSCSVHFIPLHHHDYWSKYLGDTAACPVADDLATRMVSLPIWPQMSLAEVNYVIDSALECAKIMHADEYR